MTPETFDVEVTSVEVDEENSALGYVTFRAHMRMADVREAAMHMYNRAAYVVAPKEPKP